MLLKRRKQDFKDREYDSDDDLRNEMTTYDDRMTYVNKADLKVFGKEDQHSKKEQTSKDQTD